MNVYSLSHHVQRIGQPAVMGQLLAGLLLGPSILGALWPEGQHALFPPGREQKSMLDAVSQLGILMLLETLNLFDFDYVIRYWPVLLIAAGAYLLYGRFAHNATPEEARHERQ